MKKIFIVFLTSFIAGGIIIPYISQYVVWEMWKTQESASFFLERGLDLKNFWNVYDIIEESYFSTGTIKKEDLVEWAISGMVQALGDQHSEFMNPEMYKKFDEALSWDFEWIGAVVEKDPLWVRVERIIKGSPAKKYDVRARDVIIEANGESLQDLEVFEAVEKIKGPAGTKVLLKILREGEDDFLNIELVREKIHIPSVEEKYFEDEKIAYIALNMFGETTAQEFAEALENVKKSKAEGLIIDVRDNGGWYLQSAQEIVSHFIPEGEVVVETRSKDAFLNQKYFSLDYGTIYDKKIVILINGNSASASEITAWALREYNKAILLWEKTYGKGSVQQPFELNDGSLLKLTVARWFTPQGKSIDGEGITPDIAIEFQEEDYKNLYDRQLEEAKKLLQMFIEKWSIGLTLDAFKNQNLSESGAVQK